MQSSGGRSINHIVPMTALPELEQFPDLSDTPEEGEACRKCKVDTSLRNRIHKQEKLKKKWTPASAGV